MYFKTTKSDENDYVYQYADGLNISDKPFEIDTDRTFNESSMYYGFMVVNEKNLHRFFRCMCYVREVAFPVNDPDFKMSTDEKNGLVYANKIILGPKKKLTDVDTIDYLIECGAHTEILHRMKYDILINNAIEMENWSRVQLLIPELFKWWYWPGPPIPNKIATDKQTLKLFKNTMITNKMHMSNLNFVIFMEVIKHKHWKKIKKMIPLIPSYHFTSKYPSDKNKIIMETIAENDELSYFLKEHLETTKTNDWE